MWEGREGEEKEKEKIKWAQNHKEEQKRVPSGSVLARDSWKTQGRRGSSYGANLSARCLAELSMRSLDLRALKKIPMVTRVEEREVACSSLPRVS